MSPSPGSMHDLQTEVSDFTRTVQLVRTHLEILSGASNVSV